MSLSFVSLKSSFPSILILLVCCCLSLSACYAPQELRQLAEDTPDPRQEQVEALWQAMKEVVAEETWPVELERREDLIIATSWMPEGTEGLLRRRVRFLVVVAHNGVGINATVKYQQHDERLAPEETWADTTDPKLLLRAKNEEQALAHRIQRKWQQGT